MAEGELREKLGGSLPGALDVRVWLRLLSCSTVVEKRLRRRFIERFDTTLPRFDALAALERAADGLTMGELSRALLVSNGNVTTLIRQLEAQGFVSIRADADDRRTSIVTMTALGRQHFGALAQAHREWIAAMFAQVSEADLDRLFDLLAILKRSIAAEAPLEDN